MIPEGCSVSGSRLLYSRLNKPLLEDTHPLSSSFPSPSRILARNVRKYPVMHGRPNSLLKVALPIGPGAISDKFQATKVGTTLKHDVKTTGNMARS